MSVDVFTFIYIVSAADWSLLVLLPAYSSASVVNQGYCIDLKPGSAVITSIQRIKQ